MEGVSRASGVAYVEIKIPKCWESVDKPNNGKEGFDIYKLPGLRVEEYAIVENHLLKNRVSPVDAVLGEIEKLHKLNTPAARRMARRLERDAYTDLRKSKASNKLTIEEVQEFLDSVDGMLFTMRICLERFHPGITEAEVLRVFNWQGEVESRRVRDLVQGLDALGNSTGPNLAEEVRAEPAASTGASSTDSSPKNTDGMPVS